MARPRLELLTDLLAKRPLSAFQTGNFELLRRQVLAAFILRLLDLSVSCADRVIPPLRSENSASRFIHGERASTSQHCPRCRRGGSRRTVQHRGSTGPRYVASLNGTEGHFPGFVQLIKPRGHIALIDDPQSLDINSIKFKALSFSFEFMFTRSMFQTEDIEKQHELLNRVSALIDEGTLVSTVTNHLGKLMWKL